MNPDSVKASYRNALKDTVTVRRYSGTGLNRTYTDAASIRCRVVDYQPHELVGSIQQGDRRIVMYADDVSTNGLSLPVTTNDKIVLRGKELAIIQVDDSTRRINGELIAYELQARGG